MILTYHVTFGVPFRLDLAEQWGPRVELEAIAFMNAAPIDWRLGNDPERPGLHAGHPAMRGFHDLQRPVLSGGTRGLPAANLELETRGVGDATVLVWLRPGTYPETGNCGAQRLIPTTKGPSRRRTLKRELRGVQSRLRTLNAS